MAKNVRIRALWGPRIHYHPMAASLVNGGGSFCLLLGQLSRDANGEVSLLKMKIPIFIAIACAVTSVGLLNADAKSPSDDLILAMKNSQGLDYVGEFPSPDDIEMWKFFDKEGFPVFMPAGCDLEMMTHLAWSQRMLIHWEKANGFLK